MAPSASGAHCSVLRTRQVIGVIADSAEQDVVREFFELFKTPWEFYRENRSYDVVLCTGNAEIQARAVICYSSQKTRFEKDNSSFTVQLKCGFLSYQEDLIPFYGDAIRFSGKGTSFLTIADS